MNKKNLSLILVILGTIGICTYFLTSKPPITPKNNNTVNKDNITDTTKQSNVSNNDKTTNVTPNAYDEKVAPVNTDKSSSSLTIDTLAKSLDCVEYTVKEGDTLSSICKKYTNHCSPSTVNYLICLVNGIDSNDKLNVGAKIKIPEDAINNGSLHKIVKNDTWYKFTNEYYKNYNVKDVVDVVSKINNMKDSTLILDKTIFLPSIK